MEIFASLTRKCLSGGKISVHTISCTHKCSQYWTKCTDCSIGFMLYTNKTKKSSKW